MKKEFKMNLLSSNIRHYIWALVLPTAVSSNVFAATYTPVYGDAAGTGDIAIGDSSATQGTENHIVIGRNAKAGSAVGHNQSVAIGSGNNSGEGAQALGDQSIAIGGNTKAKGDSSIAIGGDDLNAASGKRIDYVNIDGVNTNGTIEEAYSNLTGNSLIPGGYTDTTSENLAIAIGVKTTAKELSLALGTFANAGSVNTVAIGSGAKASLANSVAIGGGAVVDDNNKGTKQTKVEYDGITYKWAGGDRVAEGDVVSFGKKGFERQLKNISPGEVSENSTDAINGSQLHSIASSLTERVNKVPVVYTKPDGTKVYKVGDKFYTTPNPSKTDQPLSDADKNNLITSMVNPNGNTINAPTTLANVKGNLAVVDDANNNTTKPDGTVVPNSANIAPAAPATTAHNNAATVSDVLNSGFNLKNNDEAKDFVRHGDTLNFKNGNNTTVTVSNDDKKNSNIVVDIKDDITLKSVTIADGTDKGPALSKDGIDMNGKPITNINNGLEKYADTDPKKGGLVNLEPPANGTTVTPDNSAATVGDLRNMGWVVSSDKTTGDTVGTTKADAYTDKVKNANEVKFVGTNLATVSGKTDDNGVRTITVDVNAQDVTNNAQLPVVYTKPDGTQVYKVGDNFYDNKEGTGTPLTDVEKKELITSMMNPDGTTSTKTTLANVKDNIGVNDDGNEVGQPAGTPLAKIDDKKRNKIGNNAATVNDVLRAGWNAYVDSVDPKKHKAVVNPTDNVVFKGENGISVTSDGESADGTTVFTFSLKKGEVISTNDEKPMLTEADGSKTPVTKIGNDYYKDTDLENGVPKPNAKPLTSEQVAKVENTKKDGAGFVTGNQVADAIQANGWTVGKATEDEVAKTKFSSEAGADKVEKINPDDNIRFADGKNTIVSLGTVEAIDNNGIAKTTTTIKVDVDLPIDYKYKDANGNEVVKGDDGKFYQIDPETGKADKTKLVADQNTVTKDGAKLTDNADKPSYKVEDPITKAVEEFKKKKPQATDEQIAAERSKAIEANSASKDVITKGTGGVTLNNVAWATNPDQAVNKDQLDQTVNKAGFYVKQNGKSTLAGKDSDKDVDTEKVTANDVVDFTDGGNTKVVVTTERENGRDVTKVKVNVVGLPMQYTKEDGTPVVKVGNEYYPVKADGTPDLTTALTSEEKGKLSASIINPNSAPNEKGAPTKLGNIADGAIAPGSKEAVNGGQIFALTGGQPAPTVKNIKIDGKTYKNVVVDENGEPLLVTYNVQDKKEHITNSVISAINNMNKEGIKFFHVNDGRDTTKKPRPKDQRKNEEDSSASGKWAAAIGFTAEAKGESSLAIGHGAQAVGKQSIAIGTGNRVEGENSGAIGDPNIVSGNASYALGNDNTITANESFVVGNNVSMDVGNSVALGNNTRATAGGKVGTKNLKSDGSEGKTTTAGDKGTVKEATVSGITYGGFAGDTAHGVVSVGAAGSERRIQNVAAGEISATSTDAINGSQLHQVAAKLGDQINRNNKRLHAGIAGANAAAGLPQVYLPGKSMLAASAGTYKGQGALAVGYSRASDNGKVILKFQGNTNTSGDFGGSVGVGYQW